MNKPSRSWAMCGRWKISVSCLFHIQCEFIPGRSGTLVSCHANFVSAAHPYLTYIVSDQYPTPWAPPAISDFSSPFDTPPEPVDFFPHSGLCCHPNPCAGGTFPAFSLRIQPAYFSIAPRDWENESYHISNPQGWNSFCFPDSLTPFSIYLPQQQLLTHTYPQPRSLPLYQITACKETHWLLLAWSVIVCHFEAL